MFSSTIKKLAFAAALVSTLSLSACLQGEDTAPAPDIHLKVSTLVDAVNKPATLGKGSKISYGKVIVVLSSNVADTLRDTIIPGEQGFLAKADTTYSIDSNYVLKGLRTWKVVVTVLDLNNTVIQRDSSTPGSFLKVADTLSVTLNLQSKYAMFQAVFGPLADSISSSVVGTGTKQQIKFKRLVVRVDGAIVKDSTSPTFFVPGSLDTLYYDYLTVGVSHSVRLIAYGQVGTQYNDSIFAGTTASNFTPTAGNDAVIPTINMAWVGPGTGQEKVTVNIGKVGKTTLSGTTSGVGVIGKRR